MCSLALRASPAGIGVDVPAASHSGSSGSRGVPPLAHRLQGLRTCAPIVIRLTHPLSLCFARFRTGVHGDRSSVGLSRTGIESVDGHGGMHAALLGTWWGSREPHMSAPTRADCTAERMTIVTTIMYEAAPPLPHSPPASPAACNTRRNIGRSYKVRPTTDLTYPSHNLI